MYFVVALILIPIGAALYSSIQSVGTGLISLLIPVGLILIEVRHVEDLTEQGILSMLGWVSGLAAAIYLFPQYWVFGSLSFILSLLVLVAKLKELI